MAIVVASLLGGCRGADDPAEILRAGACDRLQVLHGTVRTMGERTQVAEEFLAVHIEQNLQRVLSDADPGPELTRSRYGDDLRAFRERVELAIYSENAREPDDPGGPDWGEIADEGASHADAWGCDQLWTLP